jgi:hypothetical protein
MLRHGFISRCFILLTLIGGGTALSCDPIARYAYSRFTPIPYCELERSAEKYSYAQVRINATLYADSAGFLVIAWPGCTVKEGHFLATGVTLACPSDSTSEIGKRMLELQTFSSQIHINKAEVVITGWFEANTSPGCWTPRHWLSNAVIEQISLISSGM